MTNLSLVLKKKGEDEGQNLNDTGVATKFLVDFQRFLACRFVLQGQHMASTALWGHFKVVIAQSKVYSPRANLLFRSNQRLKHLGHEDFQILLLLLLLLLFQWWVARSGFRRVGSVWDSFIGIMGTALAH